MSGPIDAPTMSKEMYKQKVLEVHDRIKKRNNRKRTAIRRRQTWPSYNNNVVDVEEQSAAEVSVEFHCRLNDADIDRFLQTEETATVTKDDDDHDDDESITSSRSYTSIPFYVRGGSDNLEESMSDLDDSSVCNEYARGNWDSEHYGAPFQWDLEGEQGTMDSDINDSSDECSDIVDSCVSDVCSEDYEVFFFDEKDDCDSKCAIPSVCSETMASSDSDSSDLSSNGEEANSSQSMGALGRFLEKHRDWNTQELKVM